MPTRYEHEFLLFGRFLRAILLVEVSPTELWAGPTAAAAFTFQTLHFVFKLMNLHYK